MKNTKKWLRMFTLLFALIFVLAACGGDDGTTDEPDTETAETEEVEETATEVPAAEEEMEEESGDAMADDGTFYDRAMAGEFSGTVVTMMGPFTDEDEYPHISDKGKPDSTVV